MSPIAISEIIFYREVKQKQGKNLLLRISQPFFHPTMHTSRNREPEMYVYIYKSTTVKLNYRIQIQ